MKKILASPWTAAAVSAVIYAASTFVFWKTPVVKPPPALAVAVTRDNLASWEFTNPEADQLITELQAEKKNLAKKEQDLNDLTVRLQSERSEMNLVTQSVRQLQVDFDKNVLRIREEETANLKKLAKVYATMEPDSASKIMAEMDDTSIIKIMVFMKEAETAAILETFAKKGEPEAKRAAAITERLRLAVFRGNIVKQ
jgi:flagellar motility protein MotE (MotC chaperone)